LQEIIIKNAPFFLNVVFKEITVIMCTIAFLYQKYLDLAGTLSVLSKHVPSRSSCKQSDQTKL
jgi:hypothetical protein